MNASSTLVPRDPTGPAQPSPLHRTFIGKDGLRAGWSLLIFTVLFLVFFFALGKGVNALNHKLHLVHGTSATEISAASVFVVFAVIFLAAQLSTWIMSKIERRPHAVYGLGGPRKLWYLLGGLGSGVVCTLFLCLALWSSGLMVVDARLLYGADILRYAAIWFLSFLMLGLGLEYLFRGYLQYTLTRGLSGFGQSLFKTSQSTPGFWIAALVSSLLFTFAVCLPSRPFISYIWFVLVGMIQCFSLWRTGSLWWAIGWHLACDWIDSFLFGAPDGGSRIQHCVLSTHAAGRSILSGGSIGHEASILSLPTAALAFAIIWFAVPRRHGQMAHCPN